MTVEDADLAAGLAAPKGEPRCDAGLCADRQCWACVKIEDGECWVDLGQGPGTQATVAD